MSAKEKRKSKPRTTKTPPRARKHAAPRRKKREKKPAIPPQPKPVLAEAPKLAKQIKQTSLFLAIRIRGSFGVPDRMENALHTLRLKGKFNATLLEKSPSVIGMLRHVKDYVTWGEVNVEDVAELLRERGELTAGSPLTDQYVKQTLAKESIDSLAEALGNGEVELKTLWGKGIKPVFRLRPPSGGFQYTIKRPFNSKGELGYRRSTISALISRMS